MNAYLLICKESLKAMRSVHAMVLCAVFVALNVLLGSFTIEIGKILEISFTSLAAAACSYCCGPFLGAIGGVAADLIKFMMRPSIFFIGFTFNELLLGLIYGFAFYHKPITWKRVIITRAIVTIVLNLILTSCGSICFMAAPCLRRSAYGKTSCCFRLSVLCSIRS